MTDAAGGDDDARVERIDHVQLAMPAGGEDIATAFYEGLLGVPRVPKPEPLAARGGCWFERGDVRVHLGVEADFRPARKAHPALAVSNLAVMSARLEAAGFGVRAGDLPGQAYVDDPFGNRIELVGR
jgi:catechol 2,3-dioxygenase-like lactoylglutathione lyase family enzyme